MNSRCLFTLLTSPPWLGWPLWNICVTNGHGYVPLVVNTSREFPHSWLITGFVTRLTRRVSPLEQELPTLPENPSSTPDFSGVHVTRTLFLCICFVDRCLSFGPIFFLPLCCLFFFDLRILIAPFGILKLLLRRLFSHPILWYHERVVRHRTYCATSCHYFITIMWHNVVIQHFLSDICIRQATFF